jgi:hypothetical protein
MAPARSFLLQHGDPMDYNHLASIPPLLTVVETPEFVARAEALLPEAERGAWILYLAAHPTAGCLIPGTGGVRKLRWALQGRGKRGGARVIYFFYNTEMPVFALTMFAKNERVDLSHEERNDLRRLTRELAESYRRRSHEQGC